jgi:hypothetical protein
VPTSPTPKSPVTTPIGPKWRRPTPIDYASWAADNARLAVLDALDALDARAYATELAQSLHS